MSGFAWVGVIASAFISTLAILSYGVMAVPYFDNAPYLTDLKKSTTKTTLIGMLLFGLFFAIFYWGALYLDQKTSGPLLLFTGIVLGLPISLLLGSETWDRHNGHGMSKVPGPQAVAVATGIGMAELIGFVVLFILFFQLT